MTEKAPEYDGIKVINGSLFRMASMSMSEAYKILGYKTHHALDDILGSPWSEMERAAEGKWPGVGRRRPEFTREDWDKTWAPYEAVTDLASFFVPDLIRAYPNAKVVVVQRDFDKWWPSFKAQCLDTNYSAHILFLSFIGSRFFGIRSGNAVRKMYMGFFNVDSHHDIEANARAAYDRHFAEIRALVPEDKRLEFDPAQGWEPLCEFLGKEVPDCEFPFKNTSKEHSEGTETRVKEVQAMFVKKLGPVVLGAVLCAGAVWYAMK